MKNKGTLTVITGCMGTGKTELLIEKFITNAENEYSCICYKPNLDNRSGAFIKSRNKYVPQLPSILINSYNPIEIIMEINHLLSENISYKSYFHSVFISEVQFFSKEIIDVIQKLLELNKNVYVEGLTTDYTGVKFGYTKDLIKIADKHIHLSIKCKICQKYSTEYNYRYSDNKEKNQNQILIGGSELYKAICKRCFKNPLHREFYENKKVL